MHTSILMIITLIFCQIQCFYDVPSYYGHFSRNFFRYNKIIEGNFTYFEYHLAIDMNPQNNTVYIANPKLHCIEKFDLRQKKKTILAGQCGVIGNRVGEIKSMLLNSPQSVVFYQHSIQTEQSQNSMAIKLVKNQTCDISQKNCLLSPSEAVKTVLKISNFRPIPQIILFPQNPSQKQYLYVADTGNHCIKKIDLSQQTSEVVAGKCGEVGFMDGPKGLNLLNKPSSLGVTRNGVIYFYDLGNEYMRRVNKDGTVETLLNGACRQFWKTRKIGETYQLKSIICYENWIEKETKAAIQHVLSEQQLNICLQHSSKC